MPLASLDPDIVTLINTAVPLVLRIAFPYPHGQPYNRSNNTSAMQGYEAEAICIRAVLASTGAFPQHLPFNPKAAFRAPETAACGGYAGAWCRLARDYEALGDLKHAKDYFEQGAKPGV